MRSCCGTPIATGSDEVDISEFTESQQAVLDSKALCYFFMEVRYGAMLSPLEITGENPPQVLKFCTVAYYFVHLLFAPIRQVWLLRRIGSENLHKLYLR